MFLSCMPLPRSVKIDHRSIRNVLFSDFKHLFIAWNEQKRHLRVLISSCRWRISSRRKFEINFWAFAVRETEGELEQKCIYVKLKLIVVSFAPVQWCWIHFVTVWPDSWLIFPYLAFTQTKICQICRKCKSELKNSLVLNGPSKHN